MVLSVLGERSNRLRFSAIVIATLLLALLCFAAPFCAFAESEDPSSSASPDGSTVAESTSDDDTATSSALRKRHVWFTYEYTECTGEKCICDKYYFGYYTSSDSPYPEYYTANMMLCDSDHVLHVEGDGVTADKLSLKSSNPAVLDIDSAGNVTLYKTGKAEITVTVAADEVYEECTVHLGVVVDRHDGWIADEAVHYEGVSVFMGLDLDTSDGPHQLVVPLRPGANVKYSTDDPNVVLVDENGIVTPVAKGYAQIRFDVDDDEGRYKKSYFLAVINVTGEDIRSSQEITGDTGPFTIDWHDGLKLDLHAKTDLLYSVYGSGSGVTGVSEDGFVTFGRKGSARIKVMALPSTEYKSAVVYIDIVARDYAAEEAAAKKAAEEAAAKKAAEEKAAAEKKAAEEAAKKAAEKKAKKEAARKAKQKALKKEILKAKSLKRPGFTARALSGKRIKLTWTKVDNADGYILYIKYPGTKKYVKALKKNKTVKSVTHKGLSKGRVYYYKVRAFKKVKGKVYYGPYSKAKKARAK